MTMMREILAKARSSGHILRKHDTYRSDSKKSGYHGNTEIKTEVCQKRWLLHMWWTAWLCKVPRAEDPYAILRERKKKEAHEQQQGADTTPLGLIGICGAITKKPEKTIVCGRVVCRHHNQ